MPDEPKKERDRFYSSAPWMRLRRAFLSANPLCVMCLEKNVVTPAEIADHVKERLKRPDLALDWDNLRALCSPCHTRMHKRGESEL